MGSKRQSYILLWMIRRCIERMDDTAYEAFDIIFAHYRMNVC